jgi:hypothetical protein
MTSTTHGEPDELRAEGVVQFDEEESTTGGQLELRRRFESARRTWPIMIECA